MSDVKWIKITTDIFDDEKILLIESLPDADAIIVIWFKLLCLAGKTNNSGVFMLNDIAYTDKMLSTIFRRKESTVQLALETFRKFGMIDILDGVITIPNWGKHQNLEGIAKHNEYMRNYMAEYRSKQKKIAGKINSKANGKVNNKANVNSAEEEREREEEGDIESVGARAPEPVKKTYGIFNNVRIADEEMAELMKALPDSYQDYIERLSLHKESKGALYNSDYATIRKWFRDDKEKEKKNRKEDCINDRSKYGDDEGMFENYKAALDNASSE